MSKKSNYLLVHHQSRQSPQIRHLRTQLKNKHKFKILWYHYFRYANYIGLKSFRRMGRYIIRARNRSKTMTTIFCWFWYFDKNGTVFWAAGMYLNIVRTQLSQRARIYLNKRFLPRPNITTAWKLIPYRSNNSKN